MADIIFREYTSADIPALISLWSDIFGDSHGTVSCFFRVLPDTGSCFVAECDGEIRGMASVLTDLTLKNGNSSIKAAYIYAVATDRRSRCKGIGGTLSRMAADFGRKNGAEIISTLPASDGLYHMYEKAVGLNRSLKREKITAAASQADSAFPLCPASAEEYNRKREALLASDPHISVSERSIEFLKTLCIENCGDIYISDNCCAAMYVNGETVFFPELLCPEAEKAELLSIGAAAKGKESAYCYIPSKDGERSIAYDGKQVYHNLIWNTTFE